MKNILALPTFRLQRRPPTDVASSIALKENAQLISIHAIELPGSSSFNVEGEVLMTDN